MKLRKLFTCILAISFVCTSIGGLSFSENAVYASMSSETISIERSNTVIEPRAEVTEWRYRTVGDRIQKRLFSVTYGKWLTEWEWVD